MDDYEALIIGVESERFGFVHNVLLVIIIRPRKWLSLLEKVRSDFFFSKNEFLWVLPLSDKISGSSLDHLAAVFYSKKNARLCYKVLGAKTRKKTGKLTTP